MPWGDGDPLRVRQEGIKDEGNLGFCSQEVNMVDIWLQELGDGLETVAFGGKKKSRLNHNWELTNIYPNQIKKRHKIIIITHSN